MKNITLSLICAFLLTPQISIGLEGTLVDTGSEYGLGPFYDVAYFSDTAYVVDGNDSLLVIDVTDKTNLNLTDKIEVGCDPTDVDTDGSTLIVSCAFEVHFFDLSDSASPALVATMDSPSYAINGIKLLGNRLYLAGGNSDISVLDASDLSNITNISTKTFGALGNISELKKSGNYLYVVSDFSDVRAFDISNENQVKEITLATASGNPFYDALIVGDTLYIGAGDGLDTYDISDVNNPVFSSNINSGSFFEDITVLQSLYAVGNKLYAGKINGWIFTFDISSPNVPVFDDEARAGTHVIHSFTNSEDALLVAYGVDGLRTLDISPGAVPHLDSLGSYSDSLTPVDLSLSEGRLLVSDSSGLFHVLDIDENNKLLAKSRMPTVAGEYTNAGVIKENIGWLGIGGDVETVDFSTLNPSSFLDSKTLSDHNSVTFLKEVDDTLYIGTNEGKIALYDVSNNVPSLISSVTLPRADSGSIHNITEVTAYGDYVFASSLDSEVLAVDFSDSMNPVVIDVPKLSDATDAQLLVTGDRLISVSDYGVSLIDISDISNLSYDMALTDLGLGGAAVEIDAQTIALSSSNGLLIVDIADPSNINVIQKIENAPEFTDLAYDGKYVVGASFFENILKVYMFNQAPTTSDYEFVTDEDSPAVEYVEATDPEDNEVTFSVVDQPANGNVSITAGGQFTYEPNTNFNGEDSFNFKAEDTYGGSSEGTVVMTVNSVNDAPIAASTTVSTTVDSAVSGSFNAEDVDGDELTYENTSPSNGSLSVSGSDFTYTPTAGFSGQDSFQYTATDSSGLAATGTVTINVNENSSGGGGGGSSDWWLLALLVLGVAFRKQVR